jgi:hypothetical protein
MEKIMKSQKSSECCPTWYQNHQKFIPSIFYFIKFLDICLGLVKKHEIPEG